jgi:hypothetical protein
MMDESIITTAVMNSILTMIDTLMEGLGKAAKGQRMSGPPEPQRPVDELDLACGAVISEMLDLAKLNLPKIPGWPNFPEWLKANIKTPAVQQAMGSAIRNQFNHDFIKRNLKLGMEKGAQRQPETGQPMISFDTRPGEVRKAAGVEKMRKMNEQIKTTSRELVDINMAYFLRGQLEGTQDKLKTSFTWFRGLAPALRKACDLIVRFIFATITYALFESGTYNLRPWIKNRLYHYINLEENRDMLLDLFRKAPKDQPYAEGRVVFHEDLVFKLAGAFEEALKEPSE